MGEKKSKKKIKEDIGILALFIATWCSGNHPQKEKTKAIAGGEAGLYLNNLHYELCADCRKLLLYGASMRIACPADPKPSCKKCPQHCYRKNYRSAIREIMKYSGKKLVTRGRLDLLLKHILS